MQNPKNLENETHKILWNFEIQMDHRILARRADLQIINNRKRTFQIVDFALPANHRGKIKENEKKKRQKFGFS